MNREPPVAARRDNHGHRKTFEGEEDCYFDVLIAEEMHNMSNLIKTHILNTGSLVYFNYTPNKVMAFFKEKIMLLNTCTLGLALLTPGNPLPPSGPAPRRRMGAPTGNALPAPRPLRPREPAHPADPHKPGRTCLLH